MARPSQREEVLAAVRKDLLTAEVESPDVMPINFSSVAERIGFDRRTVKRYAEEEIQKSQKAQARHSLSSARREEEAYLDKLRKKDEETKTWKAQYEALLVQVTKMELNAIRVGVNPEELYADLPVVDRSTSRAGRGKR